MIPPPDTISFAEFQQVDIRVGTVVQVEDFPQARQPAYKLWIDFGDLGVKKTSAQITDRYARSDLQGRQVLAVVNFPPKQIADFMSDVLVLGALTDHGVILIQPEQAVAPGSRIA